MTVTEFIKKTEPLKKITTPDTPLNAQEAMLATAEVWSNAACKGYLIRAAQSLNYSKAQINHLLQSLDKAIDDISVDDAMLEYQEYVDF